MDGVVEAELVFESLPEGEEGRGGKERGDRGRVGAIFNKVEVTAEEGRNGGVGGEHGLEEG